MIRVEKPNTEADDWKKVGGEEWSKLLEDARLRRKKLIDLFNAGKKIDIDEKLYKRYMSYLLALFHGKCAYCEGRISTTQPGDVEHFRPKGRVVDENFRPIRIKHKKKGEINHPGYYWLAYEWKNLLPSCIDCNRFRKSGPTAQVIVNRADAGAGKADRFPLEDEATRAWVPDEEFNEKTLLINPSELDPAEHLEFCPDGNVRPKTPRGEATLKVFGLNSREDLIEARRLAFRNAVSSFREWQSAINYSSEQASETAHRINLMWSGAEEYSAMQRLAISKTIEAWSRHNMYISLPLPE
jgi:hypothetical protein